MRRRTFVIIVMMLIISIMIIKPVMASPTEAIDQLIDKARSALQQAKSKEKSTKSILTKNQTELNKIQTNLDSINDQLKTATAKENQAKKELNQVEGQMLSLQDKLDARTDLLRARVKALYQYGPMSFVEVILNATSFSDLIERYELSSYFLRQDLGMISDYKSTYEQILKKRDDIKKRTQDLVARQQSILKLKAEAAQEETKAASKVKSTQQELAKVQSDRAEQEKLLNEFEQLQKQLGEEMKREGSSAAIGTGKMIWPVSGRRITSPFGWRMHPILKEERFHSGIDIAVPSGTPVLAADGGVVVISGWDGGYGYLVAIDHGNKISTFYGHNEKLLVKKGDKVVKGEPIAYSDSTGLSTGPHCHFEVRVNGDPVDPMKYLP